MCIVDAGAFFADPAAEFERLAGVARTAPWRPETVEQWNARLGPRWTPPSRRGSYRHFEPYDARLAEPMGRPPSWRASAARTERSRAMARSPAWPSSWGQNFSANAA